MNRRSFFRSILASVSGLIAALFLDADAKETETRSYKVKVREDSNNSSQEVICHIDLEYDKE